MSNIINAIGQISDTNSSVIASKNTAINQVLSESICGYKNGTISEMVSNGEIYYGSDNTSQTASVINSNGNINIGVLINEAGSVLDYTSTCTKICDSSTKDLTKKEIKTETVAEPTKVESDPEKPNNINDKVILYTKDIKNMIPEKEYNFSIDNLYYTTKKVDITKNNYKDTLNNEQISTNLVVSTSDKGIITEDPVKDYNSMPVYKIISSEYLEQETKVDDESSIEIEKISHDVVGQDRYHNPTVTSGADTKEIYKYRYTFSLNDVSASQELVSKAAGFISGEIDVSNCGWIELETDNNNNVEFYIIEERNETPILPMNTSYIKDEKLFYGMMPRFTIKDPNNIIVTKNGEVTPINSLDDLYLFLNVNNTDIEVNQSSFFQENEYAISYVPSTDANLYFPKTDKIRVKVIKRSMSSSYAEDINLIKIYKFNNKTNWSLRYFDEDDDCIPSSNTIVV